LVGGRRADVDAASSDTIGRVTEATDTAPIRVCVYSDDKHTREKVMLALGKRPHPDLPTFEYVESATEPAVIATMDRGDVDIAILDGEAVPAGGMGIARQLKDEIFQCPPLLVITGRRDDAWLAAWSRADAAVSHPIDPAELAEAVIALAARRRSRAPAKR
jgi:DNA-binding response OmpR family regulator